MILTIDLKRNLNFEDFKFFNSVMISKWEIKLDFE